MIDKDRKLFLTRNKRGADTFDSGERADWARESRILEILEPVIGARRVERMKQVIANRTSNLTVATENVHDPHNIAAVLRSSEAFGISDVHIVFGDERPEISHKVSQGSQKWLDLHFYDSTEKAVQNLKSGGKSIYTASFNERSIPFDDLDFSRPAAIFLGNEHSGASEYLESASDEVFFLPMYGFTSSFNISVAAALSISSAVKRRVEIFGRPGDLSDEKKKALLERWVTDNTPAGLQILLREGVTPPEGAVE